MLRWLSQLGGALGSKSPASRGRLVSDDRWSVLVGIASAWGITLPANQTSDLERLTGVGVFSAELTRLGAGVAGWEVANATGTDRIAFDIALLSISDAICQCVGQGLPWEVVSGAAFASTVGSRLTDSVDPEKFGADEGKCFTVATALYNRALQGSPLGEQLKGLGSATHAFMMRPEADRLAGIAHFLVMVRDRLRPPASGHNRTPPPHPARTDSERGG